VNGSIPIGLCAPCGEREREVAQQNTKKKRKKKPRYDERCLIFFCGHTSQRRVDQKDARFLSILPPWHTSQTAAGKKNANNINLHP
jgi:hypothetical protein